MRGYPIGIIKNVQKYTKRMTSSVLITEKIPDQLDLVNEEEKTLKYWAEIDAFQTSVALSVGRPRFSFYDGPPFATGLPHYGHILAGTIKDIVTRYAHQTGHYVDRKFGWDCHGLPVEHEIDKLHEIKGPDQVYKMGLKAYNDLCRGIVSRYALEWEVSVTRLGRWINFKNDYKTMYPWFMESVWWVFQQIYNKGLVYRSCQVMPYSTACCTPLSNFETGQNYKDVVDPAVIVKFPLVSDPNVSFIAWTTTPWTLPSNLALNLNPDSTYVKVKDNNNNNIYILMECCLGIIYPKNPDYTILERMKGSELDGVKYIPPFDYFLKYEKSGAFRVLLDTYVTEESGTGIVHSAPAFGEEDLRVCIKNGIIKKTEEVPCPVDASGCFTNEVKDFEGQYVKAADPNVIKYLKSKKLLVLQSQHKHSYPFCWRSDTPLIYKAVSSWFVNVESLIPQLLENNQQCHWVPEFVREKRFHNWLKTAKDWNISRNRFWGTPIPLWVSKDGEEVVCVGSIDELEKLSGVKLTDLHRENVDNIQIPSKKGKGFLTRTPEVFDCWFESGSMPYAQLHYPFENEEIFKESFPADFIAEGIDQTRGWFYTLLVLSTALFNKPPFKNLICSGLVLASDGQKMSKRKKNYPDPNLLINKYGADVIRLYLVNSPVVRGEVLCFKESGLLDLTKELFIPWFNAYRFFLQSKISYEANSGVQFKYDPEMLTKLDCALDQWLLSSSQSLIKDIRVEMAAYRLYTLVPIIQKFVDQITKWYIRFNRNILRGNCGLEAQLKSVNVLYRALYDLLHITAPMAPFISEYYFQHLKKYHNCYKDTDKEFESVHYQLIPEVNQLFIHPEVELKFSNFVSVVELARKLREKNNLPMKHPLKELIIVHSDSNFINNLRSLEDYVKNDINIKNIVYSNEYSRYNLHLSLKPDYALLGKKFKGQLSVLMAKVKLLSQKQLHDCIKDGKILIGDNELLLEELKVSYEIDTSVTASLNDNYDAVNDGDLVVLLDIKPDMTLENEGIARDIITRIQKLRKAAKVVPTDDITLVYKINASDSKEDEKTLVEAIQKNLNLIDSVVKQPFLEHSTFLDAEKQSIVEDSTYKFGTASLSLKLYR